VFEAETAKCFGLLVNVFPTAPVHVHAVTMNNMEGLQRWCSSSAALTRGLDDFHVNQNQPAFKLPSSEGLPVIVCLCVCMQMLDREQLLGKYGQLLNSFCHLKRTLEAGTTALLSSCLR